jgi:hypothetical protein
MIDFHPSSAIQPGRSPHPAAKPLRPKWRPVCQLAVSGSLKAAGLADVSLSVPVVSASVSVA